MTSLIPVEEWRKSALPWLPGDKPSGRKPSIKSRYLGSCYCVRTDNWQRESRHRLILANFIDRMVRI